MQINVTLFIQVFNFLIAYYFLERFLFKPVFDYIRKKNLQEKRVGAIVDQKEHDLLNLQEKKHKQLGEFKENLREKYKFVWYQEFSIPSEVSCDIKKDEIKNAIKKMKFVLLKKVPHVD
ncbi:MAG: hypothetical protein ABIA74_04265 [bacterium]